ncbi:nitrous oxide reductase family maturation protein NosD [Cohnella sp. AR92]|uniref:right-handed parallel beta-helix repeat-containing protein n=1 Tax=Cohnella sp. AR92 TaxID=648716 RepID=UPI000F8DB8D7|nr:NosD domain-containing protein [Cohnella sp. AR92]RUS42432.1 hypothetical protein ELR57_26685 [Cohnella sp. AR92]
MKTKNNLAIVKALAVGLLLASAASLAAENSDVAAASAASSSAEATDLQPLIDATPAGETLTLEKGRTYAGPAVIAKAITLRSDGTATLTNESDDPVLTVAADGVVLRDLLVRDSKKDAKKPAILLQSDRNRIEGVDIVTQAGGIFLRDADDNVLRNNRIQGASAGGSRKAAYSKRGNGIDLFASSGNVIEGNTLIRVHDGVYAESSEGTKVRGNKAVDSRYGFHFMFSGKPELKGNVGEGNVTGGMVMGVEGAVVTDNRFAKQTENVNSQGILLFDVHRSEISRNRVEGNRVGFYVENSTENELAGNEIASNFIGLQMIRSESNSFKNSAFLSNVIQAQASESKDNLLHGNYWDDNGGIDANGDGYSDMSYDIDPFFLQLTKDVEAFQVFFQSPGLPFLAQMFHSDTSNWLRDREPLMSPPDWQARAGSDDGLWLTFAAGILLLFASIFTFYRWGYRKS